MTEKTIDFISKHESLINLVLKPVLMIFIGLALSYHTLWLSSNYVPRTDYNIYTKEVNAKLDTIIEELAVDKEHSNTVNLLISNNSKRLDGLDDRIRWLERDSSKEKSP